MKEKLELQTTSFAVTLTQAKYWPLLHLIHRSSQFALKHKAQVEKKSTKPFQD